MKHLSAILFICLVLAAGGCSKARMPSVDKLPLVYKVEVQQGNVITQSMLARLKKGMDRKKVRFIMGTPLIVDVFHNDRWDYLYTFQKKRENPVKRRITLIFKDDRLNQIEGDVKAALQPLVAERRRGVTVAVPSERKKNLIGRLKDKVSFGKDDDAESKKSTASAAADPEKPLDPRAAVAAAEAAGETVLIPEDAPREEKKSFWGRMLGKIGIGDNEDATDYEQGDPKYRDPTNPDIPPL